NSLPESLGLEKGCPAPRPLRSRRSKNSVNSHVRKHAQKRISSAKAFRLYHVSLLCRLESSSRSNSSKRSNRQHPESQYSGNILLALLCTRETRTASTHAPFNRICATGYYYLFISLNLVSELPRYLRGYWTIRDLFKRHVGAGNAAL